MMDTLGLTAVVSKLWLVLLVAALAAGATLLVDQLLGDATPSASVRVGLTTAAEWPRYQSELESFANIASSSDMIESVLADSAATQLSVDSSYVEGQFVIELAATADNAEQSVLTGQLLAERSIEQQTRQVIEADAAELAALTAARAEAQSELEALSAEEQETRANATALAAEVDEEFSFEGEARYREAAAIATLAEGAHRRAQDRVASLQTRIDDVELAMELPTTELYIVRDAAVDERPNPFEGPLPMIVAGVLGALAAVFWIAARDRTSGPVRGSAALERATRIPVMYDRSRHSSTHQERLAGALQRASVSEPLLLIPDRGVDEPLFQLRSELLEQQGFGSNHGDQSLGMLTTEQGYPNADAVLLAVRRGTTTIPSILQEMEYQQLYGRSVHGLVIT